MNTNISFKPNYFGKSGDGSPEWHRWRLHGKNGEVPVTIGGSDVGVLLGLSPFKTRQELWNEKRVEYLNWRENRKLGLLRQRKPDTPALRAGHLWEKYVVDVYLSENPESRIAYQPGTFQHGNPAYPFCIVNPDGLFVNSNGEHLGIFEAKTCSWERGPVEDWLNGIVPPAYVAQVRYNMACCNLPYAIISCVWGTQPPNNKADKTIYRDQSAEAEMMAAVKSFVESVIAGENPPLLFDVDEMRRKCALDVMIKEKTGGMLQGTVELYSQRFAPRIQKIEQLRAEERQLSSKIDMVRKRRYAQELMVIEAMLSKNINEGFCRVGAKKYRIKYWSQTKTSVDDALLKRELPEIYAKYAYESQPHLRVSITEKSK